MEHGLKERKMTTVRNMFLVSFLKLSVPANVGNHFEYLKKSSTTVSIFYTTKLVFHESYSRQRERSCLLFLGQHFNTGISEKEKSQREREGERESERAFGAYKAEMILFCPKSVAIWNGSIHFLTVS